VGLIIGAQKYRTAVMDIRARMIEQQKRRIMKSLSFRFAVCRRNIDSERWEECDGGHVSVKSEAAG
jgi:hypothetical protein